MLGQLNIQGLDKVEVAIKRFQIFEPPDGYFLTFSGGKDSCVIKALADMAGVKYDAHYTVTSVDPPELLKFIKKYHPDVARDVPRDKDGKAITMWNLIPKKKMLPTRRARYCCEYLKETQGHHRFVVTGVRQAESIKRSDRAGLEVSDTKRGYRDRIDPDNPDQQMVHICQQKAQRILNPIVDWSTDEVWEFIHTYNIPYCSLYDEGFKRLGCLGCPMGGAKKQQADFERYPHIRQKYIKAFEQMLIKNPKEGSSWKTGEDVMRWWLGKDKENDK